MQSKFWPCYGKRLKKDQPTKDDPLLADPNYAICKFNSKKILPNQVAIYIWHSQSNGGAGVGHIALEVGSEYISFWPEDTPKKFFNKVKGAWHSKFQDTAKESEGRLPEFTQILSSLKIDKMLEKYKEIKWLAPEWHLFASAPLKDKLNLKEEIKPLNCMAVAVEILRAGNLEGIANETIIKKDFNKSCCNGCGTCFNWFLATIFFIALIYTSIYVGLNRYAPNDPYLQELQKNTTFNIITSVICFVSVSIKTAALIFWMQKKCCPSCCPPPKDLIVDEEKANARGPYFPLNTTLFASKKIAAAGQDVVEFPYESIRGLIEHTMLPDGKRIRKILNKAAENEKLPTEERVEEKSLAFV